MTLKRYRTFTVPPLSKVAISVTERPMRKLLLVDDDPDMVELLSYHFGGAEWVVFTAATAIEALHEARRVLPDLIVLDLLLPDLDGISVCELLRRQPSTAAIPVLMLTAVEGQLCRLASLEAGADDFVTKTIRPKALVQRALALWQRRQSNALNGAAESALS